jgi:outer membrane protein OmpA-like peptidoglycan-associated protein/subtilisin family serine protease
MNIADQRGRFAQRNLDPALAEIVETAQEDEVVEGVIVLDDPEEVPASFTIVSRFNRICTGRFPASQTWEIRQHPNVKSLKAARPLGLFHNGEEVIEKLSSTDGQVSSSNSAIFGGHGCIVAALDFGIDFGHPAFLKTDGTSRLESFWHQGAEYDAERPNRYGYGRIYLREEINAALRTPDPYKTLGYHPPISDPTGNGSHGTRTLDIAAGNGRVGYGGAGFNADLIFIHLSTPRLGDIGDLGDSVRMLEGLDYVERTAGGRPWVINLSVGSTEGSHDGTSPVEQGMHELLQRGPGRAIVQSAGNYRAANLAVNGHLKDGQRQELQWIIDSTDTVTNELDLWYPGQDRFVVAIQPPGESPFVEVPLGQVSDLTHDGSVVGRLYHREGDPNNKDNHAEVFLYPGAPGGTWTVRLIGDFVITGTFHAWIKRTRPGAQSHFNPDLTSPRYTLGTIATSPLVITVGAYDSTAEGSPLASFSSCGPTRDERRDKPELLAPGVGVMAARSIPRDALQQEGLLATGSGTSFAAPYVTGTVAAMFEAAGRPLTIEDIREGLKRSAQPVAGDDSDCWGRLDTAGAIREIQGQAAPLVSAPQADTFAAEPVITLEPGLSDAGVEDFAGAPEQEAIEGYQDEGEPLVDSDTLDNFLDRAELALRRSNGNRRESEISFLRQLLRELGGQVFAPDLSPAALFRAALRDRSLMQGQDLLRIIGMPSKQPEHAPRIGDWMLRVVPGTGDVGHLSVLASADLLTPAALASEGIAAEGTQPGYYGTVIEGGGFPHNRSRPFARRLLDSRGRVAPHTLFLRPNRQAGAIHDILPEDPEPEVMQWAAIEGLDWENAVFRALVGGERRLNALLKIGRDSGGPKDQTVRTAVLKFLRLPFPMPTQGGGIECEQQVRGPAPAKPDTPRIIFTGRYESSTRSGRRYFWAINQAGNALIAIRTMRTYAGKESQKWHQLRGDIQGDGTAVLFDAQEPGECWGYLQRQADGSICWYDGSYLGGDGKRVFVNGDFERDEMLQVSENRRPTLMESLFKSDDNYLSVLLQEREWFPLTKTGYEFLREGASSDLLRDLLEGYLKIPEGIKYEEKEAKQSAAELIVNYLTHLLWDGNEGTQPVVVSLPHAGSDDYWADRIRALKAYSERARKLFPHGHHNNAVLATHVAKMWLAQVKLNYQGTKCSFLQWIIGLAQKPQNPRLSRLLDIPLNASRSAGTYRYRLKLDVITGGFFIGYAEGTLLVEKLSSPKRWSCTFDVVSGTLGKPKLPTRDEVFDLVVTTDQEWQPDDFEGTLWLGDLTASVDIKPAKTGVTVMGGYLRSKTGWIALEDGEIFLKPGDVGGKQGKPKFNVRAEGLVGTVSRHTSKLIDLSTPFPANRNITRNLVAATHFCFGSSMLTPAGRQLLRVVCADQLAAFDSPTSQIWIIGHTDRPDTDARNQELSEQRTQNVKKALNDILGGALKVPPEAFHCLGFGEWLARFKLHREEVRNPEDRRVDLVINGSLVATFRDDRM